jgi:osmoprotectant transport system permease protein
MAESRELKTDCRKLIAMIYEIAAASLEHIELVMVTLAIAAALGLPAAVMLARHARWRPLVVTFVNVAQTVPSLAMFGFLLPLPLVGGIGKRTAVVALTLYALLPIVRNTLVGLLGVDAGVRESAEAMGMTARQILWQVELPLAAPSILAGLRIATVATVGTATIAAAIGGGGLGVFIFRGIAMLDTPTVLAGAIPAALMALAADEGLEWIERRFAAR